MVATALPAVDHAPRPITIIGTKGDPRVDGFQAALLRAERQPAALLDYRDLVADPVGAASRLRGPSLVRIDSAGRDPQVLAGLLALGFNACEQQAKFCLGHAMSASAIADHGRLLPAHQLYYGLQVILNALTRQARTCDNGRPITLMPDPATILLAFDKSRCRDHLASHQIPVPRALPEINSCEELLTAMRDAAMPRVFIKQRYGSAAAGIVALATSRLGLHAISTVELIASSDGVRLYNTRDVQTYSGPREVARLIDALVPYGLHVEAWIPKAGVDGQVADLRILVIAGEPAFRILRKSVHPITNLHLGGERAAADALLSKMSTAAVAALDDTCRRVARILPGALQLGIDVAVSAGLKRHYILEVNAFGDLLKGATRDGLDPYDMQVQAMERAA